MLPTSYAHANKPENIKDLSTRHYKRAAIRTAPATTTIFAATPSDMELAAPNPPPAGCFPDGVAAAADEALEELWLLSLLELCVELATSEVAVR